MAGEQFANQHLQHNEFLTREEEAAAVYRQKHGKSRAFKITKRTARLCNVQRLWKLITPLILRRRKDDCGLPIVEKIVRPMFVPPGTAQQTVYGFHLANPPLAAKATPNRAVERRCQLGMQLTTLRLAALCPHAQALEDAVTHNSRFTGTVGPKRRYTDLNPKSAAILGLIADLIAKGEQVIVGSPFDAFNEALHRRLGEAEVSSVLLNGSVSPKKRGQMAARYKQQEFSVIVAGLKAMGKGYSFECARHLILPSMSFALDENEQFIHRVWRLNSQRAVSIWQFIMRNTIDEVLLAGFGDKLDSAQLALDCQLIEATVEPPDLSAVLAAAMKNFDPTAPTLDEWEMKAQWRDTLCDRLRVSEHAFRAHHRPVASLTILPEPSPMARALAARRKVLPQIQIA